MYRSEFDHYNTLKLEDRILTTSEVDGANLEALKDVVKTIVKRAVKRLNNVQLAVVERHALLNIATEGLKAIKKNSLIALKFFYLETYQNALTDGSGKNLSTVNYFDYKVDPKSEVRILKQKLVEDIQKSSDFAMDTPNREYDYNPNHETEAMGALPAFITDNKVKIAVGVGAILLFMFWKFKNSSKKGLI